MLAGGERDRLDLDCSTSSVSPDSRSLERLADARDHAEPGLERGPRAPRDRLVGLAEELPALGVADDRAVDAELEQHRRARSRR